MNSFHSEGFNDLIKIMEINFLNSVSKTRRKTKSKESLKFYKEKIKILKKCLF
jgi:hypothetical protein